MVMLLVTALASFVVLATSVAAEPSNRRLHSLSIAKHIDPKGKYYPVQRDRRRFTHLMNKDNRANSSNLVERAGEIPLTNVGSYHYEAKVGVGVPPTYYSLIVDTGSADTWVGANARYVRTNTSVETADFIGVRYGGGAFRGILYNDSVTVAPGMVASGQGIGVASGSANIYPSDGILGLGPAALTFGTVSHDRIIPTVTDTLFAQGTIKENLVAVYFEPTNSSSVVNGELTFGATDSTKYIGDIDYAPISAITKSSNAGLFWGVDATIEYGGANVSVNLSNNTSGIIDSGSTLIHISTSAYNKYVKATGGVMDSNTKLLRITDAQYQSLQPIYFSIGGSPFELSQNAQIWPRALNSAINGDKDAIYLAILDMGNSLPGLDFICGMAFLERFYSVFDTGNRRVGLARTSFTTATTN